MSAPDATVIVCAFSMGRRHEVVACVRSLFAQTLPPAQIIVVVDHNEELRDWLTERLPGDVLVLDNDQRPGLSGARNTGIAASAHPIIAFIDDDAVADPCWLEALCAPLRDDRLMATGGRSLPLWSTAQPSWFPDEFLWVVGCSYEGQPRNGEVRNILGGCGAFRSELFETVGGFHAGLGRRGRRPLGCEETELCVRARRQRPDWRIELVEGAVIHHRVWPDRERLRYFLSRCYHEGLSKAVLRKLTDNDATDVERSYLRRTLTRGIARELRAAARAPSRSLGRVAAMCAGVGVAAAGFVVGCFETLETQPTNVDPEVARP